MLRLKKPAWQWKANSAKRGGIGIITRGMLTALWLLHLAEEDDAPWLYLEEFDPRVARSLCRRGWAAEAPANALDRARYRISALGLKALKVYSRPARRRDGLCPTCGTRPKYRMPCGRVYGYCKECDREAKRKARKMKRPRVRAGRPCSRCRTRPVYESEAKRYTFCYECLKEYRKEQRERRRARMMERLKKGEPVLCIRCKRETVYHTEKSVFDYCRKCFYEMQNARYHRKKGAEAGIWHR